MFSFVKVLCWAIQKCSVYSTLICVYHLASHRGEYSTTNTKNIIAGTILWSYLHCYHIIIITVLSSITRLHLHVIFLPPLFMRNIAYSLHHCLSRHFFLLRPQSHCLFLPLRNRYRRWQGDISIWEIMSVEQSFLVQIHRKNIDLELATYPHCHFLLVHYLLMNHRHWNQRVVHQMLDRYPSQISGHTLRLSHNVRPSLFPLDSYKFS